LRDVDTEVRQVNSVDWRPGGVSVPENVSPVKADSLASGAGSVPVAGRDTGVHTGSGRSVSPGVDGEVARAGGEPGRGVRPSGELHTRLLQHLGGAESVGVPMAAKPDKPLIPAGADFNEMPGARVNTVEGHGVKPEKPGSDIATHLNSAGDDIGGEGLPTDVLVSRMSAGGEDAPSAGKTAEPPERAVMVPERSEDGPARVSEGGDEVTAGVGKSAESPENPAVRRSAADGALHPELAGTPRQAAVAGAEPPIRSRTSADAGQDGPAGTTKPPLNRTSPDTKPPVFKAEPGEKPPAYPEKQVSADPSGKPSEPSVVKPESTSGGAEVGVVAKAAEDSAARPPAADEARSAEEGAARQVATDSAEDSVGPGRSVDLETTGVQGEPESEGAPAAQEGTSEGADLAARYLREAHEVLARHAGTDWSLVSPEGLGWMIRQSGDGQESAAAMVEIIRRGDPKHRVLRWTQVMAMLVARDAGVGNMQAGEGKTLVFLAAAALKAARGEPVVIITTRDGLAHDAFGEYRTILGDHGFDIVRMNPDRGYAEPVEGRPTIFIGTMEDL
ncbi:hypothetical protein ACPESR_33480, partial [Nocardia testacea]|uniref:hypothetical protein n=1 Tax=Nocardia testacea TaxID=248551 RepID=UPI003C2E5236